MDFVGHAIDGREVPSQSGDRFASVNPWTCEPWLAAARRRPRAARRDRTAAGARQVRRRDQFATQWIDMGSMRYSPQADDLRKLHIAAAVARGETVEQVAS